MTDFNTSHNQWVERMNLDDCAERRLLELAQQTRNMRVKIAKIFPRNVFRDSAWDIMLELFVAAQESRAVCVKELILVSGESSTSALRRIDSLETAELLGRAHDPKDHRRITVSLTAKGNEGMRSMLKYLFPGGATSVISPKDANEPAECDARVARQAEK